MFIVRLRKIKILPKNPAKNPAKLFQSCQKILLRALSRIFWQD